MVAIIYKDLIDHHQNNHLWADIWSVEDHSMAVMPRHMWMSPWIFLSSAEHFFSEFWYVVISHLEFMFLHSELFTIMPWIFAILDYISDDFSPLWIEWWCLCWLADLLPGLKEGEDFKLTIVIYQSHWHHRNVTIIIFIFIFFFFNNCGRRRRGNITILQ